MNKIVSAAQTALREHGLDFDVSVRMLWNGPCVHRDEWLISHPTGRGWRHGKIVQSQLQPFLVEWDDGDRNWPGISALVKADDDGDNA